MQRRRLLGSLLAAPAVLVLASCSDSDSDSPAGGTPTSEPSFPVVVQTAYGEVTIPNRPERVVTLSLDYLEALLSLGFKPVGAPTGYPFGSWVTNAIDVRDTSVFSFPVPSAGNVPIEQIASMRPDLIVGGIYSIPEETSALLSKIAPTVTHDDLAKDSRAGAWESLTLQLGKALGRTTEAERAVAAAFGAIDDVKKSNPNLAGKKVIFGGISPNGIALTIGDRHSGMRMLQAIGLEQADIGATAEDYGGGRLALSIERINVLDNADIVILGAFTDELLVNVKANPLYASLDVVKSGRVHELNLSDLYAFNTPTALNVPALIEGLKPFLAKVV